MRGMGLLRLTLLRHIIHNEVNLECRLCGHTGTVRVVDVVDRYTSVRQLVAASRCQACHAKGEHRFTIGYRGGSDLALQGGDMRQRPQKGH